MEKKLSDYLHLYLGCEVIGTYSDQSGSRGILTGITNGGTECEIQFFLEDGINVEEEPAWNRIEEVKPLLRPLESLTEEEAVGLWIKLGYLDSFSTKYKHSLLRRFLEDKQFDDPEDQFNFTDATIITNHLRSLNIDCDGLIESSLATPLQTK